MAKFQVYYYRFDPHDSTKDGHAVMEIEASDSVAAEEALRLKTNDQHILHYVAEISPHED